ncbi:hypothetical protein Marky_0955 [Marinithermus hydrothermalis DSM 14884]|uniref:Uncharacterized protein n=1 Tax=Marinithermus hydrothermalis (strain DSM 14884 / JCM 11576 / T1) TaxID=869210 RepID=F2NQH2_MARHT|nr:hypothetical protein Marky_0955 [Marinithermus hydrothermalis DSM 14884]
MSIRRRAGHVNRPTRSSQENPVVLEDFRGGLTRVGLLYTISGKMLNLRPQTLTTYGALAILWLVVGPSGGGVYP